ncbi:TetR/AcrR family transcriptional regulator [Nocardia colli]|uniref:TetR/AcrR family transcriptional regulator n=1 Tax=Nocardia colli TaxID=2545717 RepID=UPI0035E1D763
MSSESATEERLLAAALTAMSQYGTRKTTVGDVARVAGVSRATAHRFFGTRQEMYAQVAAREFERFYTEAIAAIPPDVGGLRDYLPRAIAFTLDWLRSHELFNRNIRDDPASLAEQLFTPDPEVPSALRFVVPQLTLLLAAYTDELTVTPGIAAELICRLVLSAYLMPDHQLGEPHRLAAVILDGITHKPTT